MLPLLLLLLLPALAAAQCSIDVRCTTDAQCEWAYDVPGVACVSGTCAPPAHPVLANVTEPLGQPCAYSLLPLWVAGQTCHLAAHAVDSDDCVRGIVVEEVDCADNTTVYRRCGGPQAVVQSCSCDSGPLPECPAARQCLLDTDCDFATDGVVCRDRVCRFPEHPEASVPQGADETCGYDVGPLVAGGFLDVCDGEPAGLTPYSCVAGEVGQIQCLQVPVDTCLGNVSDCRCQAVPLPAFTYPEEFLEANAGSYCPPQASNRTFCTEDAQCEAWLRPGAASLQEPLVCDVQAGRCVAPSVWDETNSTVDGAKCVVSLEGVTGLPPSIQAQCLWGMMGLNGSTIQGEPAYSCLPPGAPAEAVCECDAQTELCETSAAFPLPVACNDSTFLQGVDRCQYPPECAAQTAPDGLYNCTCDNAECAADVYERLACAVDQDCFGHFIELVAGTRNWYSQFLRCNQDLGICQLETADNAAVSRPPADLGEEELPVGAPCICPPNRPQTPAAANGVCGLGHAVFYRSGVLDGAPWLMDCVPDERGGTLYPCGCHRPMCTEDAECDDGDSCTEDACDMGSGQCTNAPVQGGCAGQPCTEFRCDRALEQVPCASDADCAPINGASECITDHQCRSGVCAFATGPCMLGLCGGGGAGCFFQGLDTEGAAVCDSAPPQDGACLGECDLGVCGVREDQECGCARDLEDVCYDRVYRDYLECVNDTQCADRFAAVLANEPPPGVEFVCEDRRCVAPPAWAQQDRGSLPGAPCIADLSDVGAPGECVNGTMELVPDSFLYQCTGPFRYNCTCEALDPSPPPTPAPTPPPTPPPTPAPTPAPECLRDSDCADGDWCTDDRCLDAGVPGEARCVNLIVEECDAGLACQQHVCAYDLVAQPCAGDAECATGRVCATGECLGYCVYSELPCSREDCGVNGTVGMGYRCEFRGYNSTTGAPRCVLTPVFAPRPEFVCGGGCTPEGGGTERCQEVARECRCAPAPTPTLVPPPTPAPTGPPPTTRPDRGTGWWVPVLGFVWVPILVLVGLCATYGCPCRRPHREPWRPQGVRHYTADDRPPAAADPSVRRRGRASRNV